MNNSFNWGDLVKEAGEGGGGGFSLIPDGDYTLKVTEASSALSGNGKQMYKIKAQIQEGALANRLIWDNLVISPESPVAMGFFFRKMASLGLPKEFFETNPSNEQIVAALDGRVFRAKIGSKKHNGEDKNEIKEYYPPAAQGQAAPQAQTYAAPAPAPAPQAYAAPAPQQAPQAPAPQQQAPQAPAYPAPPSDPWAASPQAPTQTPF